MWLLLIPALLVWALAVVVYWTLRVTLVVLAAALRLLLPAAAIVVVGLLGRLDARGAVHLETARERHENGREFLQELTARDELRYSRW